MHWPNPLKAFSSPFRLTWLLFGFLFIGLLGLDTAAADEHPDARNSKVDANPYHLDISRSSILSMGDTTVLGHFQLRTALIAQFLANPIVVNPDDPTAPERDLVGQRMQFDVMFAAGFYDLFEVGLLLPIIAYQDAMLPGAKLGTVDSFGTGNLILHSRVELLDCNSSAIGLAVGAPIGFPTTSSESYLGVEGFTVQPTVTLSKVFSPVVAVLDVGVLFQPETSLANVTDSHKLTWAIGVQSPVYDGLDVAAEFVGSAALLAPFANAAETRGEVVLGAQYAFNEYVSIGAGGGLGVLSGVGSPDYRAFVGAEFSWTKPPPDPCDLEPNEYSSVLPADCPYLDHDFDSIINRDDKCPLEPEDDDEFADEDGCPENDNDGDTVLDEVDQCPVTLEDLDGYMDDDGCPDEDNDGDGILDEDDQCPDEAENINDVDDLDGCPDDDPPAAVMTEEKIEINQQIHFHYHSAVIRPTSYTLLNEIVVILQENPEVELLIEGHTDSTGTKVRNLALSEERAQAVRNYLIENGENLEKRISWKGFGESQPIESNATSAGRSKNRRVEFIILVDSKGKRLKDAVINE